MQKLRDKWFGLGRAPSSDSICGRLKSVALSYNNVLFVFLTLAGGVIGAAVGLLFELVVNKAGLDREVFYEALSRTKVPQYNR